MASIVKRALRRLKRWLDGAHQETMPRIDALEHSTASLSVSLRQAEAAIGRLAKQHESTWGQLQDVDVRAANDRVEIAALRNETAGLVRGWLHLRTDLRRLEQRDGTARPAPDAGPTLYIVGDESGDGGIIGNTSEGKAVRETVANLGNLPFAPGSFDRIVVSDLQDDAGPALFEHIYSLLRSDGVLTFVKSRS